MTAAHRRDDGGAAVVDFVLVMMLIVPIFLGVLQVALVLHVRNTLASAASEGARYGATLDRSAADGAARTRRQISGAISGRFARHVSGGMTTIAGAPAVVVSVRAEVPALGIGGPAVALQVAGHAVQEQP